MICIYCGRTSATEICPHCINEGNNILMHDDKCEFYNGLYALFTILFGTSLIFLFISLFSSFINLNLNFDVASTTSSIILSIVFYFSTLIFMFSKNKFSRKMNLRVEEVMKERHNIR